MEKTKITKTTYKLNESEIMTAVRQYISKRLNLSDAIIMNHVELTPTLNEDLKLVNIDFEFTNIKEQKKIK